MTRSTRPRYDARRDAAPRSHVTVRSTGGSGISKVRIALVAALVGLIAYIAYAILVVRDESAIPMLALGAVLLGILFLALAAVGGRGILTAGRDGSTGRAFGLAIGGGVAAMIGFGCFAAAIILMLVLRPPA